MQGDFTASMYEDIEECKNKNLRKIHSKLKGFSEKKGSEILNKW